MDTMQCPVAVFGPDVYIFSITHFGVTRVHNESIPWLGSSCRSIGFSLSKSILPWRSSSIAVGEVAAYKQGGAMYGSKQPSACPIIVPKLEGSLGRFLHQQSKIEGDAIARTKRTSNVQRPTVSSKYDITPYKLFSGSLRKKSITILKNFITVTDACPSYFIRPKDTDLVRQRNINSSAFLSLHQKLKPNPKQS